MTIDEAIAQEIMFSKEDWHKRKEYHEQIAEWLEELKVYQQHKIICNKGYNAGYNKAIDDFVRFANTMPTVEEEDGEIRPMWLEEMAEQLKAGGKNDKSI